MEITPNATVVIYQPDAPEEIQNTMNSKICSQIAFTCENFVLRLVFIFTDNPKNLKKKNQVSYLWEEFLMKLKITNAKTKLKNLKKWTLNSK